jgi:Polyketide cyclase / dehydrase and lipid transport
LKRANTVTIKKSREIFGSIDRVWEIMSNTDEDEKYWGAIRDIKVLRKEGNTIERDAYVGPSAFSQKSRQTIVLDPKRSIILTMSGDAMSGGRTVVLMPMGKNETRVDVEWNLELRSVPGFVQGIVKNQISKATEKALAKIAADAEQAKPGAR